MAASTSEGVPASSAMKRSLTCDVGARPKLDNVQDAATHPPPVPAPAGPTVSARVQLAPLLVETSTVKMSALGPPPWLLEYQRLYVTVASGSPERLYAGLVSVVNPPSTSAAPSLPPLLPSVTQHMVPGAGVVSFSGCAMVACGSMRFQIPVVAVLGPTVQPVSVSKVSLAAVVTLEYVKALGAPLGALVGSLRGPTLVPTVG